MGSGPGGLGCAYHLRRKGYASVIFEALGKPGGMLRAGIPAWHLPEEILDAEIAKLLDLGGIEIQCGVRVGTAGELSLDELARRYNAVFLALGQDIGRRLDAEGAQARGVIGALEFLRETGLGRPVKTGTNVLVIGGGNTASDAARSAIRLGGETAEATIVSLEAEDELLIVAEDLAQAREEGVRFRPRTALVRVLADDEGNVRAAVLCEASLQRDEHGAVTPQLTEGTEVEVPCDTTYNLSIPHQVSTVFFPFPALFMFDSGDRLVNGFYVPSVIGIDGAKSNRMDAVNSNVQVHVVGVVVEAENALMVFKPEFLQDRIDGFFHRTAVGVSPSRQLSM